MKTLANASLVELRKRFRTAKSFRIIADMLFPGFTMSFGTRYRFDNAMSRLIGEENEWDNVRLRAMYIDAVADAEKAAKDVSRDLLGFFKGSGDVLFARLQKSSFDADFLGRIYAIRRGIGEIRAMAHGPVDLEQAGKKYLEVHTLLDALESDQEKRVHDRRMARLMNGSERSALDRVYLKIMY